VQKISNPFDKIPLLPGADRYPQASRNKKKNTANNGKKWDNKRLDPGRSSRILTLKIKVF
jgi:hypothetical protein